MTNEWQQQLTGGLRKAGDNVAAAIAPVIPYLGQLAVSMGAYTAGLATAQAAGMALRVSCATPVLGPLGGVLGVGFASALAGQAGAKWQQYMADPKRNPLADPLRGVRLQDMLLDAALGVALFKAMGGRFRSVMPSDLTKVGAIARESLPASGVEYATEANRRELLRIYRRDGCHHCGTRRSAGVVGDHMPPNKYVRELQGARRRSVLQLPVLKKAAQALGIPVGPVRQRYYPQCVSCSQKQAAAVRNDRLTLVFHEVLHHGGKSSAWHYGGALVGLRHYSSGGGSGGGGGGGGNGGAAAGSRARRR